MASRAAGRRAASADPPIPSPFFRRRLDRGTAGVVAIPHRYTREARRLVNRRTAQGRSVRAGLPHLDRSVRDIRRLWLPGLTGAEG